MISTEIFRNFASIMSHTGRNLYSKFTANIAKEYSDFPKCAFIRKLKISKMILSKK